MQSNIDQRIMFYDLSLDSFTDYTIALNEWNNGRTATITMDPGDYIYLACFLPFNHKYFRFATGATAAETPLIEILNAPNEWNPVVDQLDYTDGMQDNGVLQWTPDCEKSWGLVGDSSTEGGPAIAAAPVIYGAYWMRISFANAVSFELEYLGQKFSADVDLYQEYPMLQQSTILSGWKVGKTTWDDQHLLAANYISKTLVQRGILFTNNQILDIATLRSPSVHKTAHIIYSGLGAKNYAAEIQLASNNFELAMTQDKFQVDTDANAIKDREEVIMNTTSRATR